jgi:hypothetical protein
MQQISSKRHLAGWSSAQTQRLDLLSIHSHVLYFWPRSVFGPDSQFLSYFRAPFFLPGQNDPEPGEDCMSNSYGSRNRTQRRGDVEGSLRPERKAGTLTRMIPECAASGGWRGELAWKICQLHPVRSRQPQKITAFSFTE